MTKEEILWLKPQITYPKTGTVHVPVNSAKEAMDEYAKQQAIAFDVWKHSNMYALNYQNNEYVKLTIIEGKASTSLVSVDDVYAQFIEQQNKDQKI